MDPSRAAVGDGDENQILCIIVGAVAGGRTQVKRRPVLCRICLSANPETEIVEQTDALLMATSCCGLSTRVSLAASPCHLQLSAASGKALCLPRYLTVHRTGQGMFSSLALHVY
jgi:hypothetical protein